MPNDFQLCISSIAETSRTTRSIAPLTLFLCQCARIYTRIFVHNVAISIASDGLAESRRRCRIIS
eukprot:COSAG02_NODE_2174_length_9589_cov_49.732561_15_plen_64_part_01